VQLNGAFQGQATGETFIGRPSAAVMPASARSLSFLASSIKGGNRTAIRQIRAKPSVLAKFLRQRDLRQIRVILSTRHEPPIYFVKIPKSAEASPSGYAAF
jgi:hypothetical protein